MRAGGIARAAAALIALGATGTAHAQLEDLRGGGSLSYDLDYARATRGGEAVQWLAAGVGVRGFASPVAIGYGAGVGFRLGGGLSGGFLYDFDVYPVGAGVRLGRHGMVAVFAGAGASGLTGRIPFAVQLPVELLAEVQLGGAVHVAAAASARWLVAADARQDGAPALPAGDELVASLKLRLGARHDGFGVRSGNGWFVAALYQERLGERFVGAGIGYSISAWSRR